MWRTTSNVSSKLRINVRRCRSTEAPPPAAKPPLTVTPPILGPPPPIPKKSGVLWKVLGLTTVTAGGVVGYAWYDPSFRKQIEDNVPYSKDVFDTIFQNLPNIMELPKPKGEPAPIITVNKDKVITESKLPKVVKKEQIASKVEDSPVITPVKTEKQRQKEEIEQRLKRKEAEEAAENAALEIILENVTDTCNKMVSEALLVQKKVIEATNAHCEALKKAMDDSSQILNKESQWQEVSSAFEARKDNVASAQRIVNQARENLEKLKHAIDEGKSNDITKKNKTLLEVQKIYNRLINDMHKSDTQVTKMESQSKMMLKYKDLVEEGKKQFQKELESIMPEIKLGKAHGKKLTEDELNSLIAHAHRRIEQLQKQLAEQIALEQVRIQQSMEQQRKEDEKLTDQRVSDEQEKLKNSFLLQKEREDLDARVTFEQELRQNLARQAAAHSDHLKDILKVQEKELEQTFERELNTKLIEERQTFHTEVANWIARLKGIESAVEGRAEAEKLSRKSQQLWLACVALNGALLHGIEDIEVWELKIKPLANEIAAVSDAAGNHPYVNAILKTMPEISYKRGVWTHESLTERFNKVRSICKRVAMIDETGGSLFKYCLSYIQSFFIFETVYAKTEHDSLELDSLNNYSILAHAKYWIDKGELEMAVRFMNQLQGEARSVAEDWLKESKLHLETVQATQALMAFASASGLGTIF